MKASRELKVKDWSGHIFKEMVNILDIEPEYFMVNDFKGCKNGSILFNLCYSDKTVPHIVFNDIESIFKKSGIYSDLIFCESMEKSFKEFEDLLTEMKGFKYQIKLQVLLSKVKSKDLIKYSTVYLNSLTKTVIGKGNALHSKYFSDQCFNKIIFRLENWISHGSGWNVDNILIQHLNISSYRPLSGSTYSKLPKELSHPMKGLINIKNDDNKCFLWCHVRYLNRQIFKSKLY